MGSGLSEEARSALRDASDRVAITVCAEDTAIAAGSGDLPVLATPRMIALMEAAACAALAPSLASDQTSVGMHIDVRHVAPTPIGGRVLATAVVTDVRGSRVTFAVSAHMQSIEGATVEIGYGTHTRVVVDRADFLDAVESR